jgi:ribosomal protein S18 acetylase RimI-like enzyme
VIEIRPCTIEDAKAVSVLLTQLGYTVSTQHSAERVRRLSNTGMDPIILAVADGQVLGLLASHLCHMLQYEKPVMRITALVVDRQARRRGVGKLLMEHAEHLAVAAGCEIVELTSAMSRTAAHAFYHGIGYEANSLRFRRALVDQ